MNSEFEINLGKFKSVILFGNVDVRFDKFQKIENHVKENLDNWICNLYFQVERIKLADIKVDNDSLIMYYVPLVKPKALLHKEASESTFRANNEVVKDQQIIEELKQDDGPSEIKTDSSRSAAVFID